MLDQLLTVTRPPARTAEHLVGAALTALVVIGLWLAMRSGWRGKAARQERSLPAPSGLGLGGTALSRVRGSYLGTTRAAAWLERVTAHGLGAPSPVALAVSTTGLALDRDPARSFAIPAGAITDVRVDVAHGGEVAPDARIAVVTWLLGEQLLDSGIRLESAAAAASLVETVRSLIPLEVSR